MNDLRISLVQTALYWEDAGANRAHFEEKLWSLAGKTDLILLPEMFTTGFSMSPARLTETMNLHTHKWMRQMASMTGAAICGSIIIREKDIFYNRLIFIEPSGRESFYDKKHLFRMAGENEEYSPGKEKIIVELKGWKILPLICYDLRFPLWSRNNYSEENGLDYDLLIYVANWPAARSQAWNSLLPARAIENHAYCAGLNRIGEDGNQVNYQGDSAVYHPSGTMIENLGDKEVIKTVLLTKESLSNHRERFPFYLDSDL